MKVVLVTGASRGIGLSICQKFKENGWNVVGVSRQDNFTSEFIDDYQFYHFSIKMILL